MTATNHDAGYRDMSATEFKKAFGQMLEQAFRGQRIRITRHGRKEEGVVIICEADLRKLEQQAVAPLDALRAEFDELVAAMQKPAARRAAASVGTASMAALGKAALKGRKGSG